MIVSSNILRFCFKYILKQNNTFLLIFFKCLFLFENDFLFRNSDLYEKKSNLRSIGKWKNTSFFYFRGVCLYIININYQISYVTFFFAIIIELYIYCFLKPKTLGILNKFKLFFFIKLQKCKLNSMR